MISPPTILTPRQEDIAPILVTAADRRPVLVADGHIIAVAERNRLMSGQIAAMVLKALHHRTVVLRHGSFSSGKQQSRSQDKIVD
jgi:hypothetical protein